jgi:hypothetical protein
MLLKTPEAVVPESLAMGDPVPHPTEPCGDEAIAPLSAMSLLRHETGIKQDALVPADGWEAHLEMSRSRVKGAVGLNKERSNICRIERQDRRLHGDRDNFVRKTLDERPRICHDNSRRLSDPPRCPCDVEYPSMPECRRFAALLIRAATDARETSRGTL